MFKKPSMSTKIKTPFSTGNLFTEIFGILASLTLVFLFGVADYFNGYELGLSVLYLIPIYISAWYLHAFESLLVAVISSFVWSASNIFAGINYSSEMIPVANFLIRSGMFVCFAVVIRRLRKTLDLEKKFADVDFMTGAGNSHAFFEFAENELNRSKRYEHQFTLAYLDCDNFKLVNDSCGHAEGDNLLRLLTETALKIIRSTDFLARLGGDEFVILFPETDYHTARGALERLRSELGERIVDKGYPVTLSIGAVTFQKLPDSVDEMVRKADELMYRAKKQGKNKLLHELVI